MNSRMIEEKMRFEIRLNDVYWDIHTSRLRWRRGEL